MSWDDILKAYEARPFDAEKFWRDFGKCECVLTVGPLCKGLPLRGRPKRQPHQPARRRGQTKRHPVTSITFKDVDISLRGKRMRLKINESH